MFSYKWPFKRKVPYVIYIFIYFLSNIQDSWRKVISTGVMLGIPTPAFSSALAFYDGYRSSWLPANLIQVGCLFWFISLTIGKDRRFVTLYFSLAIQAKPGKPPTTTMLSINLFL